MDDLDDAVQYTGQDAILMAAETDPWLQHPDGTVVDLTPHLRTMPPGPCGECNGGFHAPTGNGPTEQGIERCDACDVHPGDLDAAAALAAAIGPQITVWFVQEDARERAGVW